MCGKILVRSTSASTRIVDCTSSVVQHKHCGYTTVTIPFAIYVGGVAISMVFEEQAFTRVILKFLASSAKDVNGIHKWHKGPDRILQ